jgi:hypothetical protein
MSDVRVSMLAVRPRVSSHHLGFSGSLTEPIRRRNPVIVSTIFTLITERLFIYRIVLITMNGY